MKLALSLSRILNVIYQTKRLDASNSNEYRGFQHYSSNNAEPLANHVSNTHPTFTRVIPYLESARRAIPSITRSPVDTIPRPPFQIPTITPIRNHALKMPNAKAPAQIARATPNRTLLNISSVSIIFSIVSFLVAHIATRIGKIMIKKTNNISSNQVEIMREDSQSTKSTHEQLQGVSGSLTHD